MLEQQVTTNKTKTQDQEKVYQEKAYQEKAYGNKNRLGKPHHFVYPVPYLTILRHIGDTETRNKKTDFNFQNWGFIFQ